MMAAEPPHPRAPASQAVGTSPRGGEVKLQEPLEELARDPKRFAHDLVFPPEGKIRVYDDTLRDGEQMPGVAITPKDKYELARMLSDIGVHVMDVGFPAVSESERETLRLVLEGRKRAHLLHLHVRLRPARQVQARQDPAAS